MKDFLVGLADHVRAAILSYIGQRLVRRLEGDSPGGDAQFDIDGIAESALIDYARANAPEPLVIYTEDQQCVEIGRKPKSLLLIDPIDGTRPASAGLEMGMISIAHAPLADRRPRIADIDAALLLEIKGGDLFYGDRRSGLSDRSRRRLEIRPSSNTELSRMFWSIEFNGHPMRLMNLAYGHLVDRSANSGGVFVFNSATYSISRIMTGQLDAYVDVGNRILKDHPHTEAEFRAAGRGAILHLFPYDIAAVVFLAELAGLAISDGYGRSLGETELLDISPRNQQSCIAASTPALHRSLLEAIDWQAAGMNA